MRRTGFKETEVVPLSLCGLIMGLRVQELVFWCKSTVELVCLLRYFVVVAIKTPLSIIMHYPVFVLVFTWNSLKAGRPVLDFTPHYEKKVNGS